MSSSLIAFSTVANQKKFIRNRDVRNHVRTGGGRARDSAAPGTSGPVCNIRVSCDTDDARSARALFRAQGDCDPQSKYRH
ncbi:hypothetical protein BC828DRAFT_265818 [Blastocladiella britannica]|nr:hypothetical protein BC828DRAFT_265818 [Blastocladiella britannica]